MASEEITGYVEGSELAARIRFARSNPGRQEFHLDVDFQVGPGITILFGPSGAGKSTLLDCIAGLLRPAEARITLGDKVLHDSAAGSFLPPRRRQIAYLFQSPALFPHMTVEANSGFGLKQANDGDRKRAVHHLLEMFRVAHLAHSKAGQISGGEAQRVALARALAPAPRVVLLDEPLKGLDAELESSMVDDLRAWNRVNPAPIFYINHQRDEVDALGERGVALDRGPIVN